MSDLQLVPVEDLVDELKTRFDAVVVAGVQHNGRPKPDRYYFYHGGFATELGLTELLKEEILGEFYDNEEEDDD